MTIKCRKCLEKGLNLCKGWKEWDEWDDRCGTCGHFTTEHNEKGQSSLKKLNQIARKLGRMMGNEREMRT